MENSRHGVRDCDKIREVRKYYQNLGGLAVAMRMLAPSTNACLLNYPNNGDDTLCVGCPIKSLNSHNKRAIDNAARVIGQQYSISCRSTRIY